MSYIKNLIVVMLILASGTVYGQCCFGRCGYVRFGGYSYQTYCTGAMCGVGSRTITVPSIKIEPKHIEVPALVRTRAACRQICNQPCTVSACTAPVCSIPACSTLVTSACEAPACSEPACDPMQPYIDPVQEPIETEALEPSTPSPQEPEAVCVPVVVPQEQKCPTGIRCPLMMDKPKGAKRINVCLMNERRIDDIASL